MKDSPVAIYLSVLSGALKIFPRGFFLYDTDNAATQEIVRYFIEEIMGYKSREDILIKLRQDDFKKHKLGGLLMRKYQNSPSKAVSDAFPEYEMQPWEFNEAQNSYWKGEDGEKRAIDAVRYVYLTKLGLSEDEVGKNLTYEIISREGLLGAIKCAFNDSLQICTTKCFPGIIPPWEVGIHVPNKYWTKDRGVQALKWVLEEKLNLSRDEIIEQSKRSFMIKHNLYGMVQRCFNSSIFEALNAAYPDEFKPWELRLPHNYWTQETIREALEWLIGEKLGMRLEDARSLPRSVLLDHKLYGLYVHTNGMSMGKIIEEFMVPG